MSTAPCAVHSSPERFDEGLGGPHEIHVAGHRLEDHRGDFRPEAPERVLDLLRVVVVEHERLRGELRGDAGRRGIAERERARARLHQQEVAVAVVAALELHDERPARESPREAQGAHHGLRSRAHEAHLLDRGQAARDEFGHLELELGRRAEGKPPRGRGANVREHFRVRVAEDHRPPRPDVVDVAVAVDVDEPRALALAEEDGRSADGAKGAHRGVHPAGDDALRGLKELLAAFVHGIGIPCRRVVKGRARRRSRPARRRATR